MTPEELESCRKDPQNQKWSVFYCCKADPRLIVPKRLKWMGWTVNVAHPRAILVSLLLITIVAVPMSIVAANGAGNRTVFITAAATISLVCLICAYLSSRTE
jgi:hypothetical protein